MNRRKAYWERRRAEMARAAAPPEPDTPPRKGAVGRMNLYDRLPKELREAIARHPYGFTKLMVQAHDKWCRGQKIRTIVAWLESEGDKRQSHAPAEREAAEAFLKELGL